MEALLIRLNEICPLSPGLKEHLSSKIRHKECSKKEDLLRIGQISSHIYFIEEGLVRGYYDVDGKETCSWFMHDGDFIIAVKSFFLQKISLEGIMTIKPCKLLYISHAELEETYKKFPEFNLHGRILLQHYYSLSDDWLQMTRNKTAYERVAIFFESNGEWVTEIPDGYLASFLGINQSTLSRMKTEYFFNKGKRK